MIDGRGRIVEPDDLPEPERPRCPRGHFLSYRSEERQTRESGPPDNPWQEIRYVLRCQCGGELVVWEEMGFCELAPETPDRTGG